MGRTVKLEDLTRAIEQLQQHRILFEAAGLPRATLLMKFFIQIAEEEIAALEAARAATSLRLQ